MASIFTDSLRGLVNSVTRLGGADDKARSGQWHHSQISMQKLEAAYRSNWIARKAVDIPAFDMMREGWEWQGEADVVQALYIEQDRHNLLFKIFEALKWARLYGGAAILVSDGADDPSEPLDVENIGQDSIDFFTPVDRHALASGLIDFDPLSPNYLEPEHYDLTTRTKGSVRIHPSRVIRILGNPIPMGHRITKDNWGDSILEAVDIAIQDATGGQMGIAALIQEAKIDVFRIPSLTDKVGTDEYRKALQDRFELANRLKSTVNALIMDKQEEYEQKQIRFTGLPDIQRLLLQIVSGAVDIPATRFLSQSPAGLSSTGESDMRNYYDRVGAEQNLVLRPVLRRLFDIFVRNAIGSYPDDLEFMFRPLWQMNEKEKSEIGKAEAEEVDTLQRTGLVPDEVLAVGLRGRLIESGRFPGIEQAYEDWGDDLVDDEPGPGDPSVVDPNEPVTDPERLRNQDAQPRTLFVRRQVMNAEDIVTWARGQGLRDVVAASDMHVTVAWSRAPIDWFQFRQDFEPEIDIEGGARVVEPLGIAGAIVLFFKSNMLEWRHRDFAEQGASWAFDQFQPHITLTFNLGDVDLDGVEPYRGKIRLGPEIWEEIDESKIGPFARRR